MTTVYAGGDNGDSNRKMLEDGQLQQVPLSPPAISGTGDTGDNKPPADVPGVPTLQISGGDNATHAAEEKNQQVAGTVPAVPAVPANEPPSRGFLLRWLNAQVPAPPSPNGASSSATTNATTILNDAGVRIMLLEGKPVLGVWRDTYTSEVQAALQALGMGQMEVRFLEDAGIPLQDKTWCGVAPPSKAIKWSEWKARALNELFLEQSATGRRGNITAATVEHGERQGKAAIRGRAGGRAKPTG